MKKIKKLIFFKTKEEREDEDVKLTLKIFEKISKIIN